MADGFEKGAGTEISVGGGQPQGSGFEKGNLSPCPICGEPRGSETPCPHCGMD